MNKKQPVFFTSNTGRKDKYLIETRIWRDGTAYYVEKRAANERSKEHLENMLLAYENLFGVKKLKGIVEFVAPLLTPKGELRFEYIDGVSAERLLLESLLLGDKKKCYEIIDKVLHVIDCLPAVQTNPTSNPNYIEVFGSPFNHLTNCTPIGIIDLNFDNVIIDKEDKWHLYDYEWVFDFPVPKQLLRSRTLWYFLIRHKEILKYYSQDIESFLINSSVYVPKHLFNRYRRIFQDIEGVHTAEQNFQKYVTESTGTKLPEGKISITEEVPLLGIDLVIDKVVREKTKKIQNELSAEKTKSKLMEDKLNKITATKSFKIARKLSHAKRKMVRKEHR
jgi:hypothetical protein